MKKILITSACVLALSAGSAFAQMQPAPGASSSGNVGPGATKNVHKGQTTGSAMKSGKGTAANPSSEGNVGPGTNNNMGKQPAGR
jgi:hypothetical protein